MILVGAFARRWGCLTAEADDSILKLIIRVLIPCLIFSAISDNPALRNPRNLIFPPLAIESLGQMAVPLALVLIGATIADQLMVTDKTTPARDRAKTLTLACLLRLGILPGCYLLLMMVLPATDDLKRVVAVEISMPSAVFGVVMARHYGGDSGTALRIVLATSFISILTMPLWIPIGLAVLLPK